MQTKTKQSNGTYKRPEPEGIAYTVKVMRTYLGWKQLVLAHEAGVNLRTIERVEAGEKVNDDSYAR